MSAPVVALGPCGSWFQARVSCPVVLRHGESWRMWCYGREPEPPGGGMDGIPMGRSGLFKSDDLLAWSPVPGPGPLGSVLSPSGRPGAFDEWLVGGTDVVKAGGGHRMYYQGARGSSLAMDGPPRRGFPLAIGLAHSPDGVTFERVHGPHDGAILPPGPEGAWDSWFAAWPRVLPLRDGGFRMWYHGRGPGAPSQMGVAESPDGVHWEKRGAIFSPAEDAAAFDSGGITVRHAIRWQGGYLMAYEAQSRSGPTTFRIGLAVSKDGLSWDRVPGALHGGASFQPSAAGWDNRAVGTPWLLRLADGSLRLFYVGLGDGMVSGIGMAICDGGDITTWRRPE